jgi:putative N6-adenine-specific DNA methylase
VYSSGRVWAIRHLETVLTPTPSQIAFFATAAKGTEGALRDELRELRLYHVRADRGGVHFEGRWEDGWFACLHSRIALRILAQMGRFEAPDCPALYDGVRQIDWTPFLTPEHTLAVSAACRSGGLTHTGFIAQKTKDAVVDQLRDLLALRPSVDRKDPDVSLFVHIAKDQATVYLDLAGESLHRRGYRAEHLEAPLKETLAAAILRLCGWDRVSPLVDPMCGSGTIPIEAALWAGNVAPGLLRRRFGFERWACHDATAAARMAEIRSVAMAARRDTDVDILGCDIDPAAIDLAGSNARKAGVRPRFEPGTVETLRHGDGPGFVVVNPPYGERLDADPALYDGMSAAFRSQRGHCIAVLAGSPAIEHAMRRQPDKWYALFNGDLECRLLIYRNAV